MTSSIPFYSSIMKHVALNKSSLLLKIQK